LVTPARAGEPDSTICASPDFLIPIKPAAAATDYKVPEEVP
jgi:hypothetical protein